MEPTGSSAARIPPPGLCSRPGGSLSPRAEFRGGHAVDRGLRSLRERPLPASPACQPAAQLLSLQEGLEGAGPFGPGRGTLLLGPGDGGGESLSREN